jgi:hypothetical protein
MGWMVNATLQPPYLLECPGTHCTGGQVGPRAGLEGGVNCRFQWDSIPVLPQPIASCYTDRARSLFQSITSWWYVIRRDQVPAIFVSVLVGGIVYSIEKALLSRQGSCTKVLPACVRPTPGHRYLSARNYRKLPLDPTSVWDEKFERKHSSYCLPQMAKEVCPPVV